MVTVGYCLLFVIDSTGRPSVGRYVGICKGRSRRPRPWFDPEWSGWLRELMRDGRMLTPKEIREIQRETLGSVFPPRRRPISTEPHGPGDQGGHEGDVHEHGGHHGAQEHDK